MKIQVLLNGRAAEFDVHPMKRMLDVIRENAGLTGAKEGCGEGECGACAAIMDGRLVDTCLIPAIQMAGREILTVEGLGGEGLDDMQRIFLEEGAVHCGFCTPGMIMAAAALLMRTHEPTDDEIRIGLSGNICRCTGYEKICRAVSRAAAKGYGKHVKGLFERKTEEISAKPIFTSDEADKFFAPQTLSEALDIMALNDGILVLSGGTDIGPDIRNEKLAPSCVMDVFNLSEMKGIELVEGERGRSIRIGACATNTDIIESPIAREMLPALVTASLRSGAAAIQNRATIGGNICTASGAGDLPVVLLALGARAVAVSASGSREMKLDDFITGYRKNALANTELLKDIIIPAPRRGSKQAFYKRGSRKALTLSRASLAFYVCAESGRIVEFGAAAGSMSPVPIRLEKLTEAMQGREITESLPGEAARIAYGDVNPRKTPQYRKTMIANITHRFFSEVVAQ